MYNRMKCIIQFPSVEKDSHTFTFIVCQKDVYCFLGVTLYWTPDSTFVMTCPAPGKTKVTCGVVSLYGEVLLADYFLYRSNCFYIHLFNGYGTHDQRIYCLFDFEKTAFILRVKYPFYLSHLIHLRT